ISVMGQVPGSMYTALLDNQLIQDPLYRDNDVKLAWIVSSALVQSKRVVLVAEGIDTVATVLINDNVVGHTDNMFVRYTFDVKAFLKPGNNSIRVDFQSAVDFAAKRAAKSTYVIPPTCPADVQHGQCHVNMIRKEQCSFSWDWGPSFPTQGIWKPIYIQSFDSAVIEDATVEAYPAGQGWELRVRVYFSIVSGSSVSGQLVMKLDGTPVTQTETVALSDSVTFVSYNITIPQSVPIERWWPNGYGNQTLYDVYILFTANNTGELSSRRRRIGFRTVELVQDQVSSDAAQGLTFYFRVNGLPVFFKGSNWIPADSFQERITKDTLQRLLQSAADAHMNSMRVWGGGVFESEDFYDLTDELGIMIWQDLMFSVAMYPTDQDFLDSVKQEVRHQVRRLMHRPSIILWAGSNENEKALRQNWFGTGNNYTLYYNDFIKLYVTTVMPVVQEEDPGRAYLTSSPSDGLESVKEGYVAKDPGSELYGDIHFYDYMMDQWVPDNFRIPRFASEYGIQAWCNYDTLLDVFEDADFSSCSTQADHREHHRGGVTEMEMEILKHLDLPPKEDAHKQFKSFIYLTQINQAMSIKSQTEHYRRHQSSLLPDGRGLTMGALYWQLNDIWQAPTWASIDYSGRWKMLQYYALSFFNSTLVSPFSDGGDLNVFVVVDEIPTQEIRDPDTEQLRFEPMGKFRDILHSSVSQKNVLDITAEVVQEVNGILVVEMYAWNNFTPLHQWKVPYKLNTTAESVFRQSIYSLMKEAGCVSAKDCFIFMYLNDQLNGPTNWLPLAELKDSTLQQAQISVSRVSQDADREFTITLATNAIAPFVWIEASKVMGRFSDNGFLMLQPTATVKFYAWQDVDVATLHSSLSLSSLMDVYQ
ncbi:hypothetical protein BaRGS_00013089, partial [Batillaria attramentaria]